MDQIVSLELSIEITNENLDLTLMDAHGLVISFL